MQVLLLKDVKGLGHAGDIKEVAGGHANNYLFPQKLARQVTDGAVKQASELQDAAARKKDRKALEAKALADKVNGQAVTFKARTGEGDRLYGSITNADVATALSKAIGQDIDRKYVEIEHPIKTVGQHNATVKIATGLTAKIIIVVERGAAT